MITRGRKRPRVRSVSFKTLGWLIRREAAYRILVLRHEPEHRGRIAVDFVNRSTRDVEWAARRALKLEPARRFRP